MLSSAQSTTRFNHARNAALIALMMEIAEIEQCTSEALTRSTMSRDDGSHPATVRLIEQLEFLHAHHARILRHHAGELEKSAALNPRNQAANTEAPALGTKREPIGEIVFAYVRLNLLAARYTQLHALGIAFEQAAVAGLSLRHLRALTPKIMECSQAIPLLATTLPADQFGPISADCGQLALQATQAAWRNETDFPGSS